MSDPGDDAVLIGEFLIRNPNPSKAPEWEVDSMPIQKESDGVTCVLEEFREITSLDEAARESWPPPDGPEHTRFFRHQLSINSYRGFLSTLDANGSHGAGGGSAWVFRDDSRQVLASFTLRHPSQSETVWEVRQFLLSDPTGNFSYPIAVEWDRSGPGEYRLDCRSIPLWSDESAWKLQLALVHSGPHPPSRTVLLKGIPFPSVVGARHVHLTTNFFGWSVTVHALGAAEPLPALNAPLDSNEPGLLLTFDRTGASTNVVVSPMVTLVEIRDDRGRRIPQTSFHPDYLSDLRNWRLSFRGRDSRDTNNPIDIRAVDLTLAFPDERHFEFTVSSGGRR